MSSRKHSHDASTSVLVVGGCGLLGHHIVQQLLNPKGAKVSVLDLHTTKNRLPDVSYYDADITSPTAVREVLEKTKPQIMIHCASPTTVSDGSNSKQKQNAKALYYKVNLEGTQNLLDQAKEIGSVKAFVYTSSSSVIHDTFSDLINANEAFPVLYDPVQPEYYSHTKALAEDAVLKANRSPGSNLLTCSLRPAAIFGPGDMQVTSNMLRAQQNGLTKVQLGDNDNLFDFTYVGNVAHAHLLAAVALMDTHALKGTIPLDYERVDGEAFFITNDEPMYFWDFVRSMWKIAGDKTEPQQVWTISKDLGLPLATFVEWLFWCVGRVPNLTRQKVRYSASTRYFDISKARRRLGYEPKWRMEEALRLTVEWFSQREVDNTGHAVGDAEKKSQ